MYETYQEIANKSLAIYSFNIHLTIVLTIQILVVIIRLKVVRNILNNCVSVTFELLNKYYMICELRVLV